VDVAGVLSRTASSILLALVVAGCARPTLPYTPVEQPRGARVSAAYHTLIDRLVIELDTDGRRVERAWIVKPDGSSVPPVSIEHPAMADTSTGGGAWTGRGAVGAGIGVGVPVTASSGGIAGTTLVTFPLAAAGPGPWPVHAKLVGLPEVTIAVGGPASAR
jgi:hypothetical protein